MLVRYPCLTRLITSFSADVSRPLPDRKCVEAADQPGESRILKKLNSGQVRHRPVEINAQQNRVEIALMIGDEQHPAAVGDVLPAVDFQIEKERRQRVRHCAGKDARKDLVRWDRWALPHRSPAFALF